MKLRLYKGSPYLYREKPLESAGGQSIFARVTIDPKYKDDAGLIHHEILHAVHWWIVTLICLAITTLSFYMDWIGADVALGLIVTSFFIEELMYRFIRPYRLWAEVKCYRFQDSFYNPSRAEGLAVRLADPKYDLGITLEEATKLLTKQ
jgi:hypothetical protein